jgi:lysine/ornithine N-monooxygenase
MIIATILDPRFKMRYIRWCFAKIYGSLRFQREIEDIDKELERLYKKYETIYRRKLGESETTQAMLNHPLLQKILAAHWHLLFQVDSKPF